ncbi:SMI1/KNR4 family protein [Capnocytophaga canimorsus]|uniref:SMI1/KNR4 family protein n=1 Tax=Capnocytophaga canimorsus TaxID=28188 RepID=UPI00385C64CE
MDYITRLKQSEEFEHWLGADNEQILYVEKELKVKLPKQYKKYLSECGMCNFGDVNILGIAKDENNVTYSVVEVTKQMRKEVNLSNDFIVLNYEVGEYLTLYKISENQELEDSPIYGVNIKYDDTERISLGSTEKLFSSFEEYFEDFMELGNG